jgi:prolipoprotein diacylglyceryltransferase
MVPYLFGVLVYPTSQAFGLFVATVLLFYLTSAVRLPVGRVVSVWGLLVAAAVAGAVLSAPSFPPTAGLRYPGVGIAVVLTLPLAWRLLPDGVSLPRFGDLVAAPLAFGFAISKLGCFFHGCCHGSMSQVLWAVAFPYRSPAWFHHQEMGLITKVAERSLPVHPLQLYFAAWSACVGLMLLCVRHRRAYDGQVFSFFLALLMGGWWVVEHVKVPPDATLRVVVLAVSLCATGVLVAQAARRRGAAGEVDSAGVREDAQA